VRQLIDGKHLRGGGDITGGVFVGSQHGIKAAE